MAIRLASRAVDLLTSKGIETLPSLTGNEKQANLTLVAPDQLGLAERALRTAGLKTKRLTGTTLSVSQILNRGEEGDEEENFDSLISSWREFHKRSSDSGYRKAARIGRLSKKMRSPGYNPIAAAKQLAAKTMELAGKSPVLRKLAHILARAARDKDIRKINKILAVLSTGPSPNMPVLRDPGKDPTDLDMETGEELDQPQNRRQRNPYPALSPAKAKQRELQQRKPVKKKAPSPEQLRLLKRGLARRQRRASVIAQNNVQSQAHSFLVNHINENGLNRRDIFQLSQPGNEARQAFITSLPDEQQGSAGSAWDSAVKSIQKQEYGEQQKSDVTYMGEDGGSADFMDDKYGTEDNEEPNQGFVVSSQMDIPVTARTMKFIAGEVVEHFVGENVMPEDITRSDVEDFIDENEEPVSAEELWPAVQSVAGAIPHREDGEKESSRRRSRRASFETPMGHEYEVIDKEDGYYVIDDDGKTVDGPFETRGMAYADIEERREADSMGDPIPHREARRRNRPRRSRFRERTVSSANGGGRTDPPSVQRRSNKSKVRQD